jgi:hypothetical protein
MGGAEESGEESHVIVTFLGRTGGASAPLSGGAFQLRQFAPVAKNATLYHQMSFTRNRFNGMISALLIMRTLIGAK